MAQLDLATHRVVGLRPAAVGPAEERRPVHRTEQFTCIEHRGDEGHVGEAGRQVLVGCGEPVEPRRVDLPGPNLRAVEEVEEEGLVRRATAHHDAHLRQRPVQAGESFVAIAAVGDDLGDHRVVLRGDHVTLGDAGVDPNSWPDGQGQRLDGARRRGERPLRILGVEPGLDGVALRRRRLALEPPAGGDVELQLDEVESGRQFRDGVLDLEAGVDLEEGERPVSGLVEELDRPGVVIAGRRGQADGSGAQVTILVGRQGDALRLLDHLLVAALHAAVANTRPPIPSRGCRRSPAPRRGALR